ncbi:PepSY domain-containing protein [Methylophilus sp.]|uniref:PepSY domain-containing protein n=1 Tax=Methylophilus sp. TaxID=29541 RepID=UPI0040360436
MRKFSTSARRWLLAACLALGVAASGWLMPLAGSGESPASAGQLSAKGQILSLEKISKLARSYKAGEILEVELEKKHGRYIYEVEILDTRSQVWELKLDAKTGQLLKMELDD